MKTAVLAAVVAATATGAMAQDIGGRYRVEGTNADGSRYSGRAEIVATSRNTCRVVWDTGTVTRGICMRNGIAFTASYVLEGKIGLVIYEIKGDGTLEGLWTIADTNGVGTERLVPAR